MPINKNELTKEMIEKAMQCKTVDELIALAKTEGFEITNEEAEAYMAELADIELDGCPETDSFSDRAITNLDVAEESENEA